MNVESSELLKVASPMSERWDAYYRNAKVKRRAAGPSGRTSKVYRRWRARQQALVASALLGLGLLLIVSYAVLIH
ncbi:MAG TPA: hypothetical protein VH560_08560 [Polyangia bacterium]|nr:hypothetical protein [Polyangia bacterium]